MDVSMRIIDYRKAFAFPGGRSGIVIGFFTIKTSENFLKLSKLPAVRKLLIFFNSHKNRGLISTQRAKPDLQI
jgi:hypothetical protein